MAGSVLEEFFIQIGVDADDLTSFQKAVLPMVQGIQKSLEQMTSSFDVAGKKIDDTQKKVSKSSSALHKHLQGSAKETKEVFGSLKTELLAFAGISLSVGGAVKFISDMTTSVTQLGVQSQALNMSAKALDGWQRSAMNAGSTAAGITNALSGVQQQLNMGNSSLHNYSGPTYEVAARLGVFNQILGKSSASDVMSILMNKLRGASEADQYTYGKMLGLDNAEIQSNMRGQFLPNVRKYTDQSNMSQAEVNRNFAFRASLTALGRQFDNLKNTLDVFLLPYAERLVAYLQQWGEWLNSHPKQVQEALGKIQESISRVWNIANKAAQEVGGWSRAIEILIGASVGLKFISILTGITGALMGPAGLIIALGSLLTLVSTWADSRSDEAKRAGVDVAKIMSTSNRQVSSPFPLQVDGSANAKASGDRFWNWVEGLFHSGGSVQNQQITGAPGSSKGVLGFMSGQFADLEAKYNLPSGLLAAVAMTESSGNPYAMSRVGAKGLFQFTDGTASQFGLRGDDVFNPGKSATAAAKYLSELISHYHGRVSDALSAYNWGPGNEDSFLRRGVGLNGQKMPMETLNYGVTVGSHLAAMRNNVTNNHTGGAITNTHISIGSMTTAAESSKSLISDVQRRAAGTITTFSSGQ